MINKTENIKTKYYLLNKSRDEIAGIGVLFYCFINAWSAFKY